MKKFILHIVIFGTIVLGLTFVADYVISKNLRKSTTRMLIGWNEIYSGNLCNEIVIMGSSKAWVQYSPQILDSILGIDSYNLGIDGSPINRQIIKYDTYRRFNAKPKIIIQDINMWAMGIRSGYEREQFFPYFSDDSLRTEISKYEKFGIFEKYFPVYRYIGYIDLILAGFGKKVLQDKIILKKGYFGSDAIWDGSKLAKQTEINYTQNSLALSLFDKYLAKAKLENIKVIFVYAPQYIEATKKIKNIEGMYAMYDSIAQKYNIPILDYNYDPISYDTIYFYNATHLNRKGAELFSAKLAHDIDSLGILK